MPQYMISVWHDDTYEVDFSNPDAQLRVAQVGAFNEELPECQVAGCSRPACTPAASATVCGPPVEMSR